MNDDLATLFSRNLSLQPTPIVDPNPPIHQTAPPEQAITYSITQHYHHSAHIAKPRPVSEPPTTDQATTEIILSRHGVDSSTLFPSQLELFKTAGPEQQMRLVELWRICPPNYNGHSLAQEVGTWPSTSFEQEESMAKMRYERQMLEERASRTGPQEDHVLHYDDMMSDGEQSNAPLTPIQGGDGRWSGAENAPEPYMSSGYEMLAQKEYELSSKQQTKDIYSHFGTAIGGPSYQATDPVYNQVWVDHTQQQQMAMENQYGAYAQQRHEYGGFNGDEEML
jgi:hypothetical protein